MSINRFYILCIILLSPLFLVAQSNVTTKSIVIGHLLQDKSLKLQPADVQDMEITDSHTDAKGVTYIYVRQVVQGKPLFNGLATIAIRDQTVLSVASELSDFIAKRILTTEFAVSKEQALKSLLSMAQLELNEFSESQFSIHGDTIVYKNSSLSDYDITLQKGFFQTDLGIRPIWHIWLYTLDHKHLYDVYLDAVTNTPLRFSDLVLNCEFGTIDADVSGSEHLHPLLPSTQETQHTLATNSYKVLPFPTESPNHGLMQVISDPANSTASPFGWHDINGNSGAEFTITRGNNVWARDDLNANNNGGTSPDGGSDLVFSAPYDISVSAELQLDAAIINLFYWNNLMHDVWYQYGFDETSGNFQENNYGKGGVGSDFVFADAQDGSGTNNANFSPLPEGQNPRMQMYLWTSGGGDEKFIVTSPTDIAGEYNAVQAGFGNNRLNTTPVIGKLVLVDDGSTSSTLACETIVNGAQVTGNIAVIDRGSCNFDDKILRAQAAGAIAVVMINNVGGATIVMGGDAGNVNIPSVMISMADGNLLKNQMTSKDVVVTMYDSSGGGAFYYDSDFDNGIIVHEYTHGISVRLTGGASNSSCLTNAEQMGEGWSDFLSLVMTHDPVDAGSDKRGIGTYVRNQATDGGGIRPYPYSTDFGINPVTYDYIKLNQFTVPHGVGSVWCSMLWDLYWAFIDVYGYDSDVYSGTGGNNMVMHLVMDGLKLQPCNPGFITGRDAIIKADENLNAGKNKLLIWQVFAKRGLGYSADQGSSASKSDGTQAFDLPPSFGGYTIEKRGPSAANAGDTILYEVVITNIGDDLLKQISLVDSLSEYGKYLSSDGRCPITFDNQTFTINFSDLASKDSIVCGYLVLVDSTVGGKEVSKDDFETDNGLWVATTITGNGGWARTTTKANSGSFSYFVNDPSTASDRTLSSSFDLTNTAEPHLVFSHLYNSEAGWDGGVVEIQVNGIWRDLRAQMVENGYNDAIANNPASNISGQPAFTGNSGEFIRTIVDLEPYAGNEVSIRFRFVSDGLQGGEGWYIDDVELWNGFGTIINKVGVEADGLKSEKDQLLTSILNEDVKDTVIIIIDVNEELVVFPNPAGRATKVRFGSKVDRTLGLELNDIMGQKIWEGEIFSNSIETIQLGGLADGMYVLSITDGEEVRNVKIIKRSR